MDSILRSILLSINNTTDIVDKDLEDQFLLIRIIFSIDQEIWVSSAQ